LGIVEKNDQLVLVFTFNTQLFKLDSIEKMSNRIISIIEQVINNDEIKIEDINISHSLSYADINLKDKVNNFNF
jgi:hypothetical protein